MARPSSIDRLPSEIREKITTLRDKGRTIDEIKAKLDELDVDVSRSSLGRHIKKLDQVVESMRRSRAVAEGIGRSFGDAEASKVARTNVELMHSLVMRLMIGDEESEEEVVLDAKEAMFVATALEKLSKASKQDFDQQLAAAKEQERRKTLEKAAEIVDTAGREKGLSAEFVEELKAKFLGVPSNV